MAKQKVVLILALLFTVAGSAFGQTTRIGENCDLSVLGLKESGGFVAFDRELREVIGKQDAGRMALLVGYPLRVNDARGSYYIKDAASLQGRFDEVFPPTVRKAIVAVPLENISCNYTGIRYGNGEVWVNSSSRGYEIVAINVPEPKQNTTTPPGHVEFSCRTDRHRLLVDIGSDGAPRYRAWNKPHSLTQRPDVEIDGGKKDLEGTGGCTHPVWSFSGVQTQITVEGLGCFPDSNEPPPSATGQLVISTEKKESDWWWCF